MTRKFYDITAKGREYEKEGQKKYVNLPAGKLCVEDGVPKWINLEWPGMNLMLSVWEQKPRDNSSEGDYAKASGKSISERAMGSRPGGRLDDDIPFGMEWR
jgi:hypothetical protein